MNWQKTPAYQGEGWRPRTRSLREEISSADGLWSSFAVNSEWAPLEAVALYKPGSELAAIKDPLKAQHLRPLDLAKVEDEYRALVGCYRSHGISVIELDPQILDKEDRLSPSPGVPPDRRVPRDVPPNLMFVRDLFFSTPEGCVIGRTASRVREGEEKFASAALARAGVVIRSTIGGKGLFEGADALWLNPRTVICGVGNRTNAAGARQLEEILRQQDVRMLTIGMPSGVQHLLGLLQIVDRDLALVRVEKASAELISALEKELTIVPVRESEEVQLRQGMNVVTVAPRRIVMAAGCPGLRDSYVEHGLDVVAELEISQLCNAAGGIACATGIVGRKVVS